MRSGRVSSSLSPYGGSAKIKSNRSRLPCMYLNTSPRTGRHLSVLSSFHYLADESVMVAVFLYADYLVAASGHKLDADAACAGK